MKDNLLISAPLFLSPFLVPRPPQEMPPHRWQRPWGELGLPRVRFPEPSLHLRRVCGCRDPGGLGALCLPFASQRVEKEPVLRVHRNEAGAASSVGAVGPTHKRAAEQQA